MEIEPGQAYRRVEAVLLVLASPVAEEPPVVESLRRVAALANRRGMALVAVEPLLQAQALEA